MLIKPLKPEPRSRQGVFALEFAKDTLLLEFLESWLCVVEMLVVAQGSLDERRIKPYVREA